MITSKEALNRMYDRDFSNKYPKIKLFKIIKQDLERLEKLEADNKLYDQTIEADDRMICKLLKENEELEKENQELKEWQEFNKNALWNLKQENQELKVDCEDMETHILTLEEENENLKETIKILTCANDSAIIQNLKAENQELREYRKDIDAHCLEQAERIVELEQELERSKNYELLKIADNVLDKLTKENQKLNKAINKACKILNWDCPVAQDLIPDLDCENSCTDDYEECSERCWKKYLLKEVSE